MFIVNSLHRAAQVRGDCIASVHEGRAWTWSQVRERVARLASVLRAQGIQAGDRVAVLGYNTDRFLQAVLSVSWAGAVVVPLNTRLAQPEITYQLEHAEVSLLMFDPEFRGTAEAALSAMPALRLLRLDAPQPDVLAPDTDTLIAAAKPLEDARAQPGDLMGIFYTGGTTGLPKGVMTTHASFAHQTTLHMMDLGWSEDTVYLHVLPMFHIGGLAAAYCVLALAARQHYMEKFDAGVFGERLAAERITAAALSPVSVGWLLDSPRLSVLDLSALTNLGYGTAPITEAILRKAMQRLPGARFTQIYGQTEITGTISVLRPKEHSLEGEAALRLRSAGRASWGVQLRVVDDAGNDVVPGAQGEVIARSPGMMTGYWRDPIQTASTLRDGWLHTGDIGYLDDEGFLFVVDRKKDMIVTGGENVYSSEVEHAIASCAGVAQVAVIGIPHPTWGEAVHAVVVPSASAQLEPEAIIRHCRALIAGFKCPKSVEIRTTPLPLSGVNKIQKHVLREPFWKDHERRIN